MSIVFKDLDLSKKPRNIELFLADTQQRVIGKLNEAFNINHKLVLGNINEISFDLPYDVDIRGEKKRNTNIDKIKQRFYIKIKLNQYEEWYIIENIKDSMDEERDVKQVQAFSIGYELADKIIRGYDVVSYNATQVLRDALSTSIWSVGEIDPEFNENFRSFSANSRTVLDFVFEIAEAFGAVVEFNTIDREINLIKAANVGLNQGLKSKYGKYLIGLNKEENSNEMVTRLYAYGKDDLSLRRINTTGQPYIEDFSYFIYPFERDENGNVIKHSDFNMSDGLCAAIIDYNKKLELRNPQFEDLLTELETYQATLTTKEDELDVLKEALEIIQDSLDVAKASGENTTTLEQQKANKQSEINAKNLEIDSVESQINSVNTQIESLRSDIAIENNFTSDQIIERNKFIIEKEWTNNNIIKDEDLLSEAKKYFEEIRKPKVIIDIDIVNFLEIVEAQRDWDKLNLGDTITLEYEKLKIDVQASITEVEFNYEDKTITLTIANVRNRATEEESLNKFIKNSMSTSTTVDMSKYKWDKSEENETEILNLINNDLEMINRTIKAGVNESVEIGRRGIIITDSQDTANMLVIQNGVLAISNNAGQDWQHAITANGIIGERIVGKLGIFAQIRADQIIVSDDGTGIPVDMIEGAEELDQGVRDDLNLVAPLPTSLRLDTSGIWAIKSTDAAGNPSEYARMDYRGLYIKGGAMQIDGGLPDSEIAGASKWNKQGTYIDKDGIYTGTIKANKIIVGDNGAQIPSELISNASVWDQASINASSAKNQVDLWKYPNTALINGGNIYANSITTNKLQAGTLTGFTIQTDSNINNPRVELKRDELLVGNQTRQITMKAGDGVSGDGEPAMYFIDGGIFNSAEIYFRDDTLRISSDFLDLTAFSEMELSAETVYVNGDFSVGGSKNAIVPTSIGNVNVSAYETAEYYFGDIGRGQIINGECRINIEELFSETVNTSIPYEVFLTPYGNGHIYIDSMDQFGFNVKGDDITFVYEIKAKRLNYEDTRLHLVGDRL